MSLRALQAILCIATAISILYTIAGKREIVCITGNLGNLLDCDDIRLVVGPHRIARGVQRIVLDAMAMDRREAAHEHRCKVHAAADAAAADAAITVRTG